MYYILRGTIKQTNVRRNKKNVTSAVSHNPELLSSFRARGGRADMDEQFTVALHVPTLRDVSICMYHWEAIFYNI
jgi:hypothetical protein